MASSEQIRAGQIADWVAPVLMQQQLLFPTDIWQRLADYLELLRRWNQHMNLTGVRDAQELVQVHLAECLLCGQLLPLRITTLLDFGSGAGLPGIPIQLVRPEIVVTLAESQAKKAMFLREAIRILGIDQAAVYGGRVEAMPPTQMFDAVTLRAVDHMEKALRVAAKRIGPDGWCAVLSTESQAEAIQRCLPAFAWRDAVAVPSSEHRIILLGQKGDNNYGDGPDVPRGTLKKRRIRDARETPLKTLFHVEHGS